VPADLCPRNDDCHRQMAEAQTRLADHFDHLFGPPGADPEEQGEAMKVLVILGQIGGKWLQFCVFLRKRGPWLLASAPIGEDPLRRAAPLGPAPVRLAHSFDLAGADGRPEQMRFGQVVQCRIEAEEPAIGGVIERVEICEGAAFFTNRFWFRAADRVLIRSEQWIGRDVPPLRLEVAVEGG
jgi:hypothetical protein